MKLRLSEIQNKEDQKYKIKAIRSAKSVESEIQKQNVRNAKSRKQ